MGHKPHSVAAVRGASRDSGDNIPFRIEPESGKVGEDVDESFADESRDVLQQDPSGSHVSDDATDRRPEPTVVVHTKALARRRERLAREAGSDEIHSAAPRLAVDHRDEGRGPDHGDCGQQQIGLQPRHCADSCKCANSCALKPASARAPLILWIFSTAGGSSVMSVKKGGSWMYVDASLNWYRSPLTPEISFHSELPRKTSP